MRKVFLILFLFVIALSCSKNETGTTITLRDKPLSTIQSYLMGRWRIRYASGGYFGLPYIPYDQKNYYFEFGSNNAIKEIVNNLVVTDTLINWVHERTAFADTSYTMNFFDKRLYPYVYVVDQIYRDTLIIMDDASDALTYRLTRAN